MSTPSIVRIWRNRLGGVIATLDGEPIPHRAAHSGAFEYGYGGSGPADLALSILDAVLPPAPEEERVQVARDVYVHPLAARLYQTFKWEFIAELPPEGGEFYVKDILHWVDQVSEGETKIE